MEADRNRILKDIRLFSHKEHYVIRKRFTKTKKGIVMEDLKVVLMSGDLGSQLYQYVFLRFLELNMGQSCLVDDSAFFVKDAEYEYQLERIFHIKLNLFSEYFSEDVWEEMIAAKEQGVSIPQQLQDNGMNLMMITDTKDYRFDGNVIYMNPRLLDKGIINAFLQSRGMVYYHGYFSNKVFFSFIKRNLQKELVFPTIVRTLEKDTINHLYQELIQLTESVAVYINKRESIDFEKYKNALNLLEGEKREYTYFIFSNDIFWCQENKKELGLNDISGEIIYVEENRLEENRHINMHLMSLSKIMVISDSFSLWAYYLNNTEDLRVIYIDETCR